MEHKDFSQWVAEVKNEPTKYRCKICHKTNGLSNMGIGALKIHLQGPSHEANAKKITNFFRSSASPTSTHTLASYCHQPQYQGKIDEIVTNSAVSEAEIQWTLKSAIAGYSNNSNADCSRLFLSMFPDSNIGKKYHVGPDKLQYSVNFGLGPYFKNILMENISKSAHLVISFDESLNKATQSSELDFLERYFDVFEMKVSTRYVTSIFLGHSRHTVLYNSFTSMMDELNENKLVQLPMDGLNVNVKLLHGVQDDRKGKGLPHLLDIGTCGLHTFHGSFKTEIEKSEWEMKSLMKASLNILHDSPARRDDYESVTKSSKLPHLFYAVRWIEDVAVADRHIEVLPNFS